MLCELNLAVLVGQPVNNGVAVFLFGFAVIAMLLIGLMQIMLIVKGLKKVPAGFALLRTGAGGVKVVFDRTIVIPFLHQHELINIASRKMRYERTGNASVIFSDRKRIEFVADVMLRINKDTTDVALAANELGPELINDSTALQNHFSSRFNYAIETAASQMTSEEFVSSRETFRERLLKKFGNVVNGMTVDDIAIHHAEPAN